MTKDELMLLLNHEDMFQFFFNGIADQYSKEKKSYEDQLPQIDYNERFQHLPNSLYKFIDLDGGLKSINDSNIKFSDPLSFWKHDSLSDKTEFWFDRLYIDNDSLDEMYSVIVQQHPDRNNLDRKSVFIFLLHNHILNLTKRNRVLCLAKNHSNDTLWESYRKGICIEYDTTLFRINKLNFPNNKKYDLIGNPICYVDQINKYPIRTSSYSWLSNLIFVKQRDPYANEDEYRILCTDENYNPVQHIKSREERIQIVVDTLIKRKPSCEAPLYPTFNKQYIKKVYFKNTIHDEGKLLQVLEKAEIPWEKLL